MGKKRKAVIIVSIILIGSIALTLLNQDDNYYPFNPDIISNEILFHEILYSTDSSQEFIEFLTLNEEIKDYSNLLLNISGEMYNLPELTSVEPNSFVMIFFSIGIDDTDGSDNTIAIYLNTGESDNLADTGEAYLAYNSTSILDYVRWGGLSSFFLTNLWASNDQGPQSLAGESIQLFGLQSGSSKNWLSSKPTPGKRNALEFTLLDFGLTFLIENGATTAIDFNIEKPSRWNISDNPLSSDFQPVSLKTLTNIKSITNFTTYYFNQTFFPLPYKENKDVRIVVQQGSLEGTVGAVSLEGAVALAIGTNSNDYELSVALIHELFHLSQQQIQSDFNNDSINHMPEPSEKNNWLVEGMAEYWAVFTTADYYEVPVEDIQNALFEVGTANWIEHGRSGAISTFYSWNQSWDDYIISFLFMTYLMQTYGLISHTLLFYGSTNNFDQPSNSVSAIDAFEFWIQNSLDEELFEFYMWRVLRNSPYEIPEMISESNLQFGSVSNSTFVTNSYSLLSQPGGVNIQELHLIGEKEFELRGELTSLGTWKIGGIAEYRNGSRLLLKSSVVNESNTYREIIDPQEVSSIKLLNYRYLDDTSSLINVTVREAKGLSPKRAVIIPTDAVFNFNLDYEFWGKVYLNESSNYAFNASSISGNNMFDFYVFNRSDLSDILVNTTLNGYSSSFRFGEMFVNTSDYYLIKFFTVEQDTRLMVDLIVSGF